MRPSNRRRCIDATLQQPKMQRADSRPAREATVPSSSSPRFKAATLEPSKMHRCDPPTVEDASMRLCSSPRCSGPTLDLPEMPPSHPPQVQDAKQPTLQPSKMHRCDPAAVQAGSGSMDQLGRSPLRVPSVGKCASQKKKSIQDATWRLSTCRRCHRPILHKSKMQSSRPSNRRRCIDATLQQSKPARDLWINWVDRR